MHSSKLPATKKVDILGVKVDAVSMNQAIDQVRLMLDSQSKHQIVTPNPEIVSIAQKNTLTKGPIPITMRLLSQE